MAPWVNLQDVRNLSDANLICTETRANDDPNRRKQMLTLRCDFHNEQMSDLHVFKHLRHCNQTEAGGRNKLHTNRVNLNPISILLDELNIRELICRFLTNEFWLMMLKFKRSLQIFTTVQPALLSKKVPQVR